MTKLKMSRNVTQSASDKCFYVFSLKQTDAHSAGILHMASLMSTISFVKHIICDAPEKLLLIKNLEFFTGWLGAMSMSVSFFVSPIIIGFCRRKSTRLTAVMGGLVTALGCLFTSFASQFHQLFLSYGFMIGKESWKNCFETILFWLIFFITWFGSCRKDFWLKRNTFLD